MFARFRTTICSLRVLGALLCALALTACGTSALPPAGASLTPVSIALDDAPNAVHTGIYAAIARDYDRDAGIELHVINPSGSTDGVRLLQTGRVNFAILDIHDLAIARAKQIGIVGVMAIVQQPLTSVIAAPEITDPKLLQGQTVGVTGDPSDTAVLDSIVKGSGGDPAKVHTITIGNAVSDLLAGHVAAATASWNTEGVSIQQQRPEFHVYRAQDYGAPVYPELVLSTTEQLADTHPQVVRAVVTALTRGYQRTISDPTAAQQELEQQVPALVKAQVFTQLAGLEPAFTGPDGVGVFDLAQLRRWAVWEQRFGIVKQVPDVRTMFDTRFAMRQSQTASAQTTG